MFSRLAIFLLPPLRAFRRDIGDRHFIVIGTAIVIAVASVTAVDLFTDRIRNALARQSGALLAADLAIISNYPLPAGYREYATSLELKSTQILSMRSVVAVGENLQLTELKAVAVGYPLRGEILLAPQPFAEPQVSKEIPMPGTVWVEARLLPLIGVTVGARIRIGAADFEISKILVLEPDRGGDLFNIAPRVMLNRADIRSTGLIAPGSRVRYSLLVAGEQRAVERFSAGLELRPGDRILSPAAARPEIRTALRRAEQYLGLAAFTTIILAGVAIVLAAGSFSSRHKDTVALLRTLGATRHYVLAYFMIEILLLGILMTLIGAALGVGCQAVIAHSMSGWTQAELPPPSAVAALRAALTTLIALTGFALPPLMNLRNIPPLRVLRSDADAKPTSKSAIVIYAVAASAFMAPWRAGNWAITLWSLLGLAICLAALVLATAAATGFITRLRGRRSLVWRFGVANIVRRGVLTVVQITALGLGLMALLVLSIVRNDLLDSWVASLPPDAPNQFLINIQRRDVASLKQFFERRGVTPPTFFPMVRGRLTAINDDPITPEAYIDPDARRLAEREFNLSWSNELKSHNKIVAGRWWDQPSEADQFSIEEGIADTLGMSLGDSLTFRVADREVRGIITNLRAVQWDSMQVNFFVESPTALLVDFPATFITSFQLDTANYPLLTELVRTYPNITVIDIAALIDHVRTIMDHSASAIEFVFLFTFVAGMLVLVGAVQATQDERVFESALLKTLGASRMLTMRIMSAEFLTIGFIAGAVAGSVALLAGWLIATRVLEIEYAPDPSIILIGLAGGITSVSLIGSIAVYSALRRPAAIVLSYRN